VSSHTTVDSSVSTKRVSTRKNHLFLGDKKSSSVGIVVSMESEAGTNNIYRGLKEGWLSKRGEYNKSYKKRYFRIEKNLLAYFSNQSEVRPKGAMYGIGKLGNNVCACCCGFSYIYIIVTSTHVDILL